MSLDGDGETLAVGYLDGTIELWNVSTQKLFDKLRGHAFNVTTLWFADDSRTLHSTGVRGNMKIWELSGEEQRGSLGADTHVTALAFSPSGEDIAVQSIDQVRLWSPTLDEIHKTPIESGHYAVAFSQDWIAAALDGDGVVHVWDLSQMKLMQKLHPESEEPLRRIAISRDGRFVATYSRDGSLQLWDRSTPSTTTIIAECTLGWGTTLPVEFSIDSQALAIGHMTGVVSAWDPDTLTLVRKKQVFSEHQYTSALAFSPDGQTLAAGNGDGQIVLWDYRTVDAETVAFGSHAAFCGALRFSTDGSRLYSGDLLGYLKSWSVTPRQELYSLRHESRITDIELSPDGKTLAAATWGVAAATAYGAVRPEVRLWHAPDMPTPSPVPSVSP